MLGITRRGYGASTHPATGYNLATRAHDILAVIDQQGLDQVIVVGHSIAGDEMTKFSGTYPNRVRALVYLDAAYDRTKVTDLPQPAYPEPSPDTYSSIEKFSSYMARVWNWRAPDAETYNALTVTPDGRVDETTTAPNIPAQVVKLLEPPDCAKVRAPALALYSRPDIYVPHIPTTLASRRSPEPERNASLKPVKRISMRRSLVFAPGQVTGESKSLTATTILFFTNEAEVVRLIDAEFLAGVR